MPRRRIRLHPHKTSWQFDWRNEDMDVLRRPFVEVMPGFYEQQEVIMDKDESLALARESFKETRAPDWRTDPSYNWVAETKRKRKRK